MVYNILTSRTFLYLLFIAGIIGLIFLDYFFSHYSERGEEKENAVSEESIETKYSPSPLSTLPPQVSMFPSPSLASFSIVPVSQKNNNNTVNDILKDELLKTFTKDLEQSEAFLDPFLFGKIPLTATEPLLQARVTEYFEKKGNEKETILKLYEFTEEYSDSLYGILYKKSKEYVKGDPESRVVEIDGYAEKSFVIRLESEQKVMYLVLASKNEVIGVLYPIGDNFSHHNLLAPILKRLFRSSQ